MVRAKVSLMATSPRDRVLSKDQRNQLYLAIASSKLNPADCEFKQIKNLAECIVHPSSDSEFVVEPSRSSESYLVATRTAADVYLDRANRYDDFNDLVSAAKGWADAVAKWIDAPEFWENPPSREVVPGELIPESDNTPFTSEEQKAISDQLKAIAESVKKNCDLTAEQSAKLDEKFDEAEKASRRMGRKDWGLLFGGAVFSLILADVITPGVAGHILLMIEHALGHLSGAPPVGGTLAGG